MRQLYCTSCPQECLLTVTGEQEPLQVTGNHCPKGEKFAHAELTAPMRILTTTVLCHTHDGTALLPVRTEKDIPLSVHLQVMALLRTMLLPGPVKAGDAVVSDVLGLHVDVVASRDLA